MDRTVERGVHRATGGLAVALGDGEGINTDVEIFGRDLERELKKQAPGKVVAFRRDRRGGKKPLS